MGGSSSKQTLEKALADCPENIYGLENFGNTCYANSVLQALYFCGPFRDKVLAYAESVPKGAPENLLTCLADLFSQISNAKKKTGAIAPRKFIERLKEDNELFRSFMHQDAHEFLNYLLNEACEILEKAEKSKRPHIAAHQGPQAPIQTWVHDIFQGKLVNETRCLLCETVTRREEVFMDLSLEIEQNCSLTSCLRNFSATETLDRDDKFFCDHCCCLQEAQKRLLISKLPKCLILHLKRFKYVEAQGMMRKLMYRVVFPLDLKLSNTTEAEGADSSFDLTAVVVHVGTGPTHGHYVSLVNSHSQWLFFDDENVDLINEAQIQSTFGSAGSGNAGSTDHGYLLFYENKSSSSPSE